MSEQVSERVDSGQNSEIAERLGQLMRSTNDDGKTWEGVGQTHFWLAQDDQGQFLVGSNESVVSVSPDGHQIGFVDQAPETAELPITPEDRATMMVLGALATHPLLRDELHPLAAEFSKLTMPEKIWLAALEIDRMAPGLLTASPRAIGFIYLDVTSSRATHYRLSYLPDIDDAIYPVIERGKGIYPGTQLYTYERFALTIANAVAYRTVLEPGPNTDHYSNDHLQPMHDILLEMRDRAWDIGWRNSHK